MANLARVLETGVVDSYRAAIEEHVKESHYTDALEKLIDFVRDCSPGDRLDAISLYARYNGSNPKLAAFRREPGAQDGGRSARARRAPRCGRSSRRSLVGRPGQERSFAPKARPGSADIPRRVAKHPKTPRRCAGGASS